MRAIAKDGFRLNRHILVAVEVVARARMQLRPRVAPGMARAVARFAKEAAFAATNGSLRRGVTVDANLKHGVPTLVPCVPIAYAVPACSIDIPALFLHIGTPLGRLTRVAPLFATHGSGSRRSADCGQAAFGGRASSGLCAVCHNII